MPGVGGIVSPLRIRWAKGVCVFTAVQKKALLFFADFLFLLVGGWRTNWRWAVFVEAEAISVIY